MKDIHTRIAKELDAIHARAKRLEEEIVSHREYGEALRYVISVVQHELRVPLEALLGAAERLARALPEGTGDDARELVGVIGNNVQQIAFITSHLDPASDMSAAIPVEIELRGFTLGVFASLQVLSDAKKVRLVWEGPAVGPVIEADRNKLTEVLLNLIENGIKYNREGGTVTVSAVEGLNEVEILIADTGRGMDPALLSALAPPVGREGETRRPDGSRGLGLAIVDQIVRDHGGSWNVQSHPDSGSTFRVRLPRTARRPIGVVPEEVQVAAAERTALEAVHTLPTPAVVEFASAAAPEPVPERAGREAVASARAPQRDVEPSAVPGPADEAAAGPPRRAPGEKFRLLLVDDDIEVVTKLASFFPESEFEVMTAHDGPKTLMLASARKPHLITLDVLMIGLNGFEVLSSLKSNPATRDIPVVMLSNVRGESKAAKLGAVAYIQKPVTATDLLKTVRRFLPH